MCGSPTGVRDARGVRRQVATYGFGMPSVDGAGQWTRRGLIEKAFQRVGVSGTFGEGGNCGQGIPAIHFRFSPFRGLVRQDPVQRQETQIVQPCK